YAASRDRITAASADSVAIRIELTYQLSNGWVRHSLTKLPAVTSVGTAEVELSVPSGLSAAESTNTMGNSENATAARPTRCRQPIRVSHRVTSTPPPACGSAGS